MPRIKKIKASEIEISPCPFCGGKVHVNQNLSCYTISCGVCYISMIGFILDEIINRWNGRTHNGYNNATLPRPDKEISE